MALHEDLAQATGSYWIGGKSGRSFRGVYKTPKGTTIRVASNRDEGHTFQLSRIPSRSSFCCIYSWYVVILNDFKTMDYCRRSGKLVNFQGDEFFAYTIWRNFSQVVRVVNFELSKSVKAGNGPRLSRARLYFKDISNFKQNKQKINNFWK